MGLALLLALAPRLAHGGDLAWTIAIDAEADPARGVLRGTASLTATNLVASPIATLQLFRFPDHFADRPDGDDLLLERVFPRGFSPGGIAMPGPVSATLDGRTFEAALTPLDNPPRSAIVLPAPLQPSSTVTVSLPFETRVPHRYGTFGRHGGVLTATGWYPLPVDHEGEVLPNALPALAATTVRLRVPEGYLAVVAGGAVAARGPVPPPAAIAVARADGDVLVVDAGTLRFAPLTIARRAEVLDIPLSEGVSMRFIGRKPSRGYVRWLRRAATETRAVLRSLGAEPPLRGLVVVEAPLRRRLVEIGDGVVFVSDRLFDAERPFWRYEDVHLAQGLFVDALRDRADADEPGTLLPFVLDGVSWSLVDDYLRARWKNHVNLRSLLQRFTFLPAIDVLLETPTFPFADQVFDNPYSMDPLGDDIRRFNRPPRTGRMLMLRLADHVGERSLDGAIAAWIGERSRRPLFAEIEARTGFDATTYAQSFLGDVPRLDLRLLDVERSRDPHGFHLTHVEADRVTLDGTSQDEPVDIVLRAGRGRQVRLVWIGAGEAAWDVRTEHRVGRVTIDPAARLLEVDADGFSLRQDDQLPRPVKLSGYGYFVALNATASSFEAHGVLNVRPAHDHRHGVSAAVFADARTRLGAGLSYARWFGARRFGPYRQQRLVFGADFSWLDERFQPTDSPLQAELRTSWVFENRASSFRPSRGGRAVVTGFLGRDFAPGKESQRAISDGLYGGFDTLGVVLLPLAPFHVLALKGKAGFVVGGRDHTLLPLGGSDDLRGMPEGSGLMSVRAIGVAEWRHDFFRDADLPLLLSRWRGLQGSLFLEGGAGLPTAGGAPVARASFGYGLRWFVDWLGLLPGAFGIDIAWSPGAGPGRWPLFPLTPDRWPEVPFQAYLVGSQSF